jgi:hypothetical protein
MKVSTSLTYALAATFFININVKKQAKNVNYRSRSASVWPQHLFHSLIPAMSASAFKILVV